MTLKTQPTGAPVDVFLQQIKDKQMKADCETLCHMLEDITACKPVMWGKDIVGFGSYHYKYQSGKEGDWFLTGFSPRKKHISIYVMDGFDHYDKYLEKLGKVKTSVSCLSVYRLSDINNSTLAQMIAESVTSLRIRYEA